jgi:hypothetical protein
MINPRQRPLERLRAETPEGTRVILEARMLARRPQYAHLSDGELLRLAYWGASGETDYAGRAAQAECALPNAWPSLFWFCVPGALCFAYAVAWYLAEVVR